MNNDYVMTSYVWITQGVDPFAVRNAVRRGLVEFELPPKADCRMFEAIALPKLSCGF
jgi:hypothetical protein